MRVVDAMGVVQIDSVNVLVRSQELPLFSRLGPHDRSAIPKATAAGRLFEYWAHAAAHVPTEHHRLWRWKMESHHDGPWEVARDLRRRRPGFVDEVHARVAAEGPLAAGDLSERTTKKNPWWDWDDAKVALEYLFYCGRVTATRRTSDFARLYDLPERVIPIEHLNAPTPSRVDAQRELVAAATRSLGVGTVKDIADYYRLKQDEVKPRLVELVEDGRVVPASIDDRRGVFFVDAAARVPRNVDAQAFLSMFDPVVWHRDRGRWLFDFDYTIEIYTPAAKRRFGYYVLPFLSGDRLVARADLKADRASSTLIADGVFAELGVDAGRAAAEIADELRIMADWLELEHVKVGSRGDLAARVRRARGARR
ncbi:MAG: hypothetical protein RIS41_195 [Actinomycetota bacterium]|jgi:uncharacterized protein YcaQ